MNKLIVFEGIDGSGKTTALNSLAQWLSNQGENVATTFQPGGTEIGQKIRNLLVDAKQSRSTPKAELLLFLADRAHHVETVIKPALERGDWVICDRYTYSTIAYQSAGRGIEEDISELLDFAECGVKPSTVFFIDTPPSVAAERLAIRKGDLSCFDAEKLTFHNAVSASFKAQADEFKDQFITIDGTQSIEDVSLNIISRFTSYQPTGDMSLCFT